MKKQQRGDEDCIYGIHAVIELIRHEPKRIRQLCILPSSPHRGLSRIAAMAREQGIQLKRMPKNALNRYTDEGTHQGVVAIVDPIRYRSLQELLALLPQKKEAGQGRQPLLVVADCIEDPHNLGAIIRSAHAMQADGIIIQSRRAVQVTGTVAKAAAGAVEHMPIARVTNIAQTLTVLNEHNFLTVATVVDAEHAPWDIDWKSQPVAVVIGSEAKGVRPLVRKTCQQCTTIPMGANMQSLNASVAAGMILYEIMRARSQAKI